VSVNNLACKSNDHTNPNTSYKLMIYLSRNLGSETVIIGRIVDDPLMVSGKSSTANCTFANDMNLRCHNLPNKRAHATAWFAPSVRSLRSSGARCVATEAVLPDQMHRVRGADGLPEDGVGPADLLAEPPKRVPNRHPRDAERERTLTTLAPREAAAASSAPLSRTDERDRRLPRRRVSWRARPASRGARRPSSSSRFPSPPARRRPSGGRAHS